MSESTTPIMASVVTQDQVVVCAKCKEPMRYHGWNEFDQAHIWSVYQCDKCDAEVFITDVDSDDPHHPDPS